MCVVCVCGVCVSWYVCGVCVCGCVDGWPACIKICEMCWVRQKVDASFLLSVYLCSCTEPWLAHHKYHDLYTLSCLRSCAMKHIFSVGFTKLHAIVSSSNTCKILPYSGNLSRNKRYIRE